MQRIYSPVWLLVLYGLVVSLSLLYVSGRLPFISIDTDYRYYMEFAEHALTPGARFSESAIITGGTSLLQTGEDGAHGMHVGIHFEPLKYATTLLWQFFGPWGVHVWYALGMYLPLLVAYWRARRQDLSPLFLYAVLAYTLAPAAFAVLGEGIRPFTLLYPFLFLFVLSLIEQRPISEQASFLLGLALVREEGLLYAAVGVTYLFLSRAVTGQCARNAWRLCALLAVGFGVYAAYVWQISAFFEWRSFSAVHALALFIRDHIAPLLVVLGIVCAALVMFWRISVVRTQLPRIFLTCALIVPLIGAPVVGITELSFSGLFFSRYGMLGAVTGIIVIALWAHRKPEYATSS